MILETMVLKGRYVDSIMLMNLAAKLEESPGVERAFAVMGTEANKALLDTSDLLDERGAAASDNDLVIAVMAKDQASAQAALGLVEAALAGPGVEARTGGGGPEPARTMAHAKELLPDASVAVISVPGRYVRPVALDALDLGLHPFIFSDNVPIEDEIFLKSVGEERGLLVMGPDCGTSIIGGLALGFANSVPRGPVGIVGASGTGIQEVTSLLARRGVGVRQAIGVGGRDLKARVGASSMLRAMDMLEADPDVRVGVLISKPPDPEVASKVVARAKEGKIPYLVCFMGGDPYMAQGLPFAGRLDVAARMVEAMVAGDDPDLAAREVLEQELDDLVGDLARAVFPKSRRFVRGLFSGGTLCREALQTGLDAGLTDVWSNLEALHVGRLDDPTRSRGNCYVDLGEDFFTQGRPHPMIDFTIRNERLLREARDPEVGVLLLDVVLGYGAHPDPAAALLEALAEVPDNGPVVVASITGTDQDPQRYGAQRSRLEAAGVVVMESNGRAATLAARLGLALA